MTQIAPSMLAADFLHLEKDMEFVNSHADLIHLDIMDGTFVPNISYGFPIVEAIAKIAQKPMDAHLMIVHPERYVDRFAKAGVQMLSFHLNAVDNPGQVLAQIRAAGLRPGLAINPDIPVEKLYPYLDQCDYVVLMSVFAGFGGQRFIDATYERLSTLKAEIVRQGVECLIQVDGGISAANSGKLARLGADILVAGNSVFKAEDPAAVIDAMRR